MVAKIKHVETHVTYNIGHKISPAFTNQDTQLNLVQNLVQNLTAEIQKVKGQKAAAGVLGEVQLMVFIV